VVIGREIGDLVLSDPQCSSRHAELLLEGGRLLLRDLGSTNGTWRDGARITELILQPGMAVQIGGHRIELQTLHGDPGGTQVAPAGIPPEPPRFVLAIQAKGQAPSHREFMERRITIGRSNADLALPDSSCSNLHAELVFEGGRLRLRDLGSTNGTFVQGQRIQELEWLPGTVVNIGSHQLTLLEIRIPGQAPLLAPAPPPLPAGPPAVPAPPACAPQEKREIHAGLGTGSRPAAGGLRGGWGAAHWCLLARDRGEGIRSGHDRSPGGHGEIRVVRG
jgi:pSer/pThr/pTyr-binding forkhead associated (FHA) protein